MNRWNFFVVVAVSIVCYGVCKSHGAAVAPAVDKTEDIGVRPLPDHDSEAMSEFKRGLNAEETDLLKRHISKTRFIQPLMDNSRVMVSRRSKMAEAVKKRDEVVVAEKRCCSCQGGTSGCYHPDDVKRSNIIQCCHSPPSAPQTVAVSERGVQVDKAGQKALSGLSPEDQALLQRYSSKIKNLVEAQQRPESNGNTVKRQNEDEAVDAAGQQALDSLSQADKDLLQKYLSKIDNLVEAEHRPESNGNTDKREQEDDVESNEKRNEVDSGTVIQKLYDQLEGLKQVVGDLKAQQQHVDKKEIDETVSDSSKVHKASDSKRASKIDKSNQN